MKGISAAPQIRKRFFGGEREFFLPCPDAVDGALAKRLHIALFFRFGAFIDPPKGAEVDGPAVHSLPCVLRGQRPHITQIVIKGRRIGCQRRCRVNHAAGFFQRGGADGKIAPELVNQKPAPDGFPGIRAVGDIQHFFQRTKPRGRIRITLHAGEQIDNERIDRAVVAPRAQHVQRGGDLRLAFHFPVGIFQRCGQSALPELLCFLLIADAKIRRKLQCVRIFPQNDAAEGVNRRNLRQIDAAHLPLQMPVVRLLGQPFAQCGNQFPAKLRRRRLREGNHQKIIHIALLRRIGHTAKHAVDKHLCLAGTRRGRNEERPAAMIDGGLLLARQFQLTHAHPPLR